MGVYVKGFCPQGCGQALALDEENRIVCSSANCPDPGGVDDLLSDSETDHIVLISKHARSITHPLREHGHDELDCPLYKHLDATNRAPTTPGRYRVVRSGLTWSWRPTWTRDAGAVERQPEVDAETAGRESGG